MAPQNLCETHILPPILHGHFPPLTLFSSSLVELRERVGRDMGYKAPGGLPYCISHFACVAQIHFHPLRGTNSKTNLKGTTITPITFILDPRFPYIVLLVPAHSI